MSSCRYRPPYQCTQDGIYALYSNRQHLHTKRQLSETNRQVHRPRKQCLINRERHEHETGKDMDRYRQLSVIWKSDLTDKIKRSFFQAAVVSIQLYECTTWTLTKRMEKKFNGNYTRMLRAIRNKSWKQHSSKQHLYSHQPPITKTIKIRRTRRTRHCRRSREELISDVLLWTLSHGRAKAGRPKAGRPARTYIQQLWRPARGYWR